MKLSDVTSVNELTAFLEKKGLGHQNYRHYTNFDGALGMLQSGYMHLSRGDQMNDHQEVTKGNLFD